jgi:hypothetical protein
VRIDPVRVPTKEKFSRRRARRGLGPRGSTARRVGTESGENTMNKRKNTTKPTGMTLLIEPFDRIFEFTYSGKREGVTFMGDDLAKYDDEGHLTQISLRQALIMWRQFDELPERYPDGGYDPSARVKFLRLVENQLSTAARRAVPGKN